MWLSWVGQTLAEAGIRVKWTGSSMSIALRVPQLPVGGAPASPFPFPFPFPPQGPAPAAALAAPGCGHTHHATPAPEQDALAWDGLLKGVQKQKNSHSMTRTRNSANSKLHPTVGAY